MNKDRSSGQPGNEAEWEAQIDAMMEQLTIETAPASLSRRLRRIPRDERRKQGRQPWLKLGDFPRWVMVPAFAAVPLVVLTMMMQPKQPSAAEIEQARQDLAIAFTYLDKVGSRTGSEIRAVLGGELRHGVKDPLSEHLPFTEQSLKEETT